MRTFVILAAFLIACGPSERNPGSGGGGGGGGPDSGGGGGGGDNGDGCSDAAKLVYVVDSNNKFSKFDPATKTFTDLGTLACPASQGANPFSMGVDRNAVAWVLYSNDTGTVSELFRVDTTDPNLACTKSTWATQQQLIQFGMGFSANMQGGTEDTLFIAGGTSPTGGNSTLATLSTQTFTATPVGDVTGWPELTGTGNAELWGWFPSDALGFTTPRVEQIDKTNGDALKTYNLPALKGAPMAWAFAFWGGDFWIFLQKGTDQNTFVYQIDGMTGMQKGTPLDATGRKIVGAGVSTCAPVVIL